MFNNCNLDELSNLNTPDSGLCGGCKEKLSPSRSFPTCEECLFTYHFKCVTNIYQSTWKRYTVPEKKKYKCSHCSGEGKYIRSSRSSSASSSKKRSRETSLDSDSAVRSRRLRMGTPTQTLSQEDKNEIVNGIAEMLAARFDSLEKKLEEEIKATQELREETHEELKAVQARNAILEEQVRNLQDRLESVENRVEASDQYSMKNDLIINGIPTQENESTSINALVDKLALHLKVQLTEYDVTAAHRLQKKENGDASIIVRFSKYSKKEELKTAARRIKPTARIFGGDNKVQIFLNDHLTRRNGTLFRQARQLRNEPYNFKFIWFRNGKIYARKLENSPVFTIRKDADIEKLMA